MKYVIRVILSPIIFIVTAGALCLFPLPMSFLLSLVFSVFNWEDAKDGWEMTGVCLLMPFMAVIQYVKTGKMLDF